MQRIIGLSGKKQSGKDSAADYCMNRLDLLGKTAIKTGFAESLKRDICINLLGLSEESCYGTDEEKNKPTHLRWECMPGVITRSSFPWWLSDEVKRECYCGTTTMEAVRLFHGDEEDVRRQWDRLLKYHPPGAMTGREVMEFFGTEIFRKINPYFHVNILIDRIKSWYCDFVFVTDVRFPNEVEAIQKIGGKVYRLTRNIGGTHHASQTALDPDRFDWSQFDGIICNNNAGLNTTNEMVWDFLNE